MPSEAATLSAIAFRAKAHWGYSAATLENWRQQLSVTPTQLQRQLAFVADVDGEPAGFYLLAPATGMWSLEHLWVAPEFMGRGMGSALLEHALRTGRDAGASQLRVDADPNAEAFYVKMGAARVGDVAAPIAGHPDRRRPVVMFFMA
jgi:GNAT superfamily N-acetyltransferase